MVFFYKLGSFCRDPTLSSTIRSPRQYVVPEACSFRPFSCKWEIGRRSILRLKSDPESTPCALDKSFFLVAES